MRVIIPKLFQERKGRARFSSFQFVEHGNLLSFPSMTRLLVRLLLLRARRIVFERIMTPVNTKWVIIKPWPSSGNGQTLSEVETI